MAQQKKQNIIPPPFVAEAVCAALLQHVSVDDIKTSHIGNFKKRYSSDVERLAIEDYKNSHQFEVHINRNSIYDLLPEGLFHQTLGSNRIKNVQDAVQEHKRFKEEEKAAKRFFSPVEQMLFRYRIHTEVAESKALFDIQNGKLNSSFYKFWGIQEDGAKKEAERMVHLMPYCNFIKGNVEATETALSYILSKPVQIERRDFNASFGFASPKKMGDSRLGIDTVLGEGAKELLPYWEFTIKDIAQAEVSQYVESGSIGRLLARFTEIFIPLELDTQFELNTMEKESEEECEDILGYASYL